MGAFVIKDNATRLVDQLKSEGEEAYIQEKVVKKRHFYAVMVRRPSDMLGRERTPVIESYETQPTRESTVPKRIYKSGRLRDSGTTDQRTPADIDEVKNDGEKQAYHDDSAGKQDTSTVSDTKRDETAAPKTAKPDSLKRRIFGIGAVVNAVNFSAGPAIIVWPLPNVGIQASYSAGTYTSYEVRGLYRFDLVPWLSPYVGAGYLHTEKKVSVQDVQVKLKDDNISAFLGFEIPLYEDRLMLSVEGLYTPTKLKTQVDTTNVRYETKVDYKPVSLGVGLIYYFK
jgi:opacity protein-like surface antigen